MNTNAMRRSDKCFYICQVVFCVIVVSIMAIYAFNHEAFQHMKWRRMAVQEPDKYSVCLVCKEVKPHKLQYDYGVDVWIDDECSARYTQEDMWIRVKEELKRRNQ